MEFMIPITMFICIAAVMILRPITKRLGKLIDVIAREREQQLRAPSGELPLARVTTLLESVSQRLDRIEDRMDFVERLGDGRTASRTAGLVR